MNYGEWIFNNEPKEMQLYNQRSISFSIKPKISIVIPVWNPPIKVLEDCLNSACEQSYTNWELCIADGNSSPEIKKLLFNYVNAYGANKIKVKYLNENKGIVGNTNEALSLATGDFITFLDHDDTLAMFALFEIVRTINDNPDVDFLYSDEDKIEIDNRTRHTPHFKPKVFSPDLLRACNYICHLSIYKKSLLDEIGGLREGFDGSQDYDLILRATEKAKEIKHIRGILYHWKTIPGSTSVTQQNKDYTYDSAQKALREHLERIGMEGEISKGFWMGSYKIKYKIKNDPLVTIIIPNRNQYETLKNCIDSILYKTSYKKYEILILENNSTEEKLFKYYEKLKLTSNTRIVKYEKEGEFNFSEINNFGVEHAKGEYVLFLNNDTQVMSNDWLSEMLGYAQREDVGIVGAKLYYPNGTIQHAGVGILMGGTAGHPYCKAPVDILGYMGKLKVPQNLMAVTGACLLTKKSIIQKVGAFDPNLRLAFNDVEFCVRVHQAGYKVVWTPYAELIHYESLTRGYEDTPEKMERFGREARYIYSKWKSAFDSGDPYFY